MQRNGKIVKQIMQFRKKGDNEPLEFIRVGSIYENLAGRQNGIIDLNVAEESPKGDESYLKFVLTDPYKANNVRNKQYKTNFKSGDHENFKQ